MKVLANAPAFKGMHFVPNQKTEEFHRHPAGLVERSGDFSADAWVDELDPVAEDAYWRDNYSGRPYVMPGESFEAYEHAYRTGYENFGRYLGESFDEVEDELRQDYGRRTGAASLSWERVREAARDAWQRIEDYIPGESDDEVN